MVLLTTVPQPNKEKYCRSRESGNDKFVGQQWVIHHWIPSARE